MPLPKGYSLVSLDEIDSTNEEAKRRIDGADATPGDVIWSRTQSAGRGRQGRRWLSPEGNLYFSLILRPRRPAATAAEISFVAAVALGDTVAPLLGAAKRVTLKWPNDLLIEGRKAAGILLESFGGPRGFTEWLILGVGVNLASHPSGTDFPATSISAQSGRAESPRAVLEFYLGHFDSWLARWRGEGFAPVRRAWLRNAAGLGGPITVRIGDEVIAGTFRTVNENGALELDGADGATRVINAGDVFFPGQD